MTEFDAYAASDTRPVLLVDSRRTVLRFNRPARIKLRTLAPGMDLAAACAEPVEVLSAYLGRCTGTRGPVPSLLRFHGSKGEPVGWRCDGGLLHAGGPDAPATVILRLRSPVDAHAGFLALKDQVTLLNRALDHSRQLQRELEEALQAKEILLAEVNHRVKNNLQVITSMLSLAAHEHSGPAAFRETADRIRAMARVHEMMLDGDLQSIDCSRLLIGLAGSLEEVHQRPLIRLKVEVEPLRLSADRATSIALLVNELVSNAYKHAFPNGGNGSIRVRLARGAEGMIELSVIDDGIPLPKSPRTGTGLKIANALAAKLGGNLEIMREPFKAFGVAFPEH